MRGYSPGAAPLVKLMNQLPLCFLGALILISVGCSSVRTGPSWSHPTANESLFNTDARNCANLGRIGTRMFSKVNYTYGSLVKEPRQEPPSPAVFESCMERKGYKPLEG